MLFTTLTALWLAAPALAAPNAGADPRVAQPVRRASAQPARRPAPQPVRRPTPRPLAQPAFLPPGPPPIWGPPRVVIVAPPPPPPVYVRPAYVPPPVYVAPPPPPPPPRVAAPPPPRGPFDRDRKAVLGLRGGTLVGAYRGGEAYADFDVGVLFRYRPVGPFAVEALVTHADATFRPESERRLTSGAVSAMAFLVPYRRVSPYLLAGVTLGGQQLDASGPFVREADLRFGPHGGLGLEIAIADGWAVDLEARTVGWVTARGRGDTFPVTLQAGLGVVAHF